MIDHFGINCANYVESQEFYDKVLHVLGYHRVMDFGEAVGYGTDGKPSFWIADAAAGDANGPNREVHIAFAAKDAESVQAFFHTALALGVEPLHEPRLWPEYHPAITAPSSATPRQQRRGGLPRAQPEAQTPTNSA